MRDIKPFVSKIKKLLGKNKARPLLLVMFLIVMLSFCYKNQNKVQAVGNSLFEGFKEGASGEGTGGGRRRPHKGHPKGQVTKGPSPNNINNNNTVKALQSSDAAAEAEEVAAAAITKQAAPLESPVSGFRGKRESGLFKRRRRDGIEDKYDDEEEDAFRGRRRGFLGRRLGFRGKKEGMEPLDEETEEAAAEAEAEAEAEEQEDAFRGRRRGFLGRRLGFRGKKEGMGSVPSKKQVMEGMNSFSGFGGGCAANASSV